MIIPLSKSFRYLLRKAILGKEGQYLLNMHAPLYDLISTFLTHKHID